MWVIVERVVHLITLVLLVVMLSIIFTNNKSSQDLTRIDMKIEQYRADRIKAFNNNADYFQDKVNKLAEAQDMYQILVDRRLHVMEITVKSLSDSDSSGRKIINTNLNNNIMNK